ncbi:hypothetical protein PG997_004386 [Apiospora hydei]|uniref:Uncharacterized protein n=1 Tax=Apiospora hydei TaxID=1337664 RepID=A0ABR1X226_9PEZI
MPRVVPKQIPWVVRRLPAAGPVSGSSSNNGVQADRASKPRLGGQMDSTASLNASLSEQSMTGSSVYGGTSSFQEGRYLSPHNLFRHRS